MTIALETQSLANIPNPKLDHANPDQIFYPSEDGEPLAESQEHVWAITTTLDVLTRYLKEQRAIVLADQFLYYSQGFPRLRVAPDVMVIFNVEPGLRDNYKIWEEGEVPAVVFEITSPSTQQQDQIFKKNLYEQLGVQEYWLFDPKGEYLPESLMGYRLGHGVYYPMTELRSTVLGLRLAVEESQLTFYREDNAEKLLVSQELEQALVKERQRGDRLAAKLRELGIDPQQL